VPATEATTHLTPLLERAAWMRVRWPQGDVLEGHQLPRLDEPVLAGSLFKVVAARAALEQGAATPATAWVCPRRLEVHGRRVDCAHPDLGRPLTLEDALAHSCNHFFVRIAERLDRARLTSTLRRLSDGQALMASDTPLPLVVLGLDGPRQGMRGWMRTVLAAMQDHDTRGQMMALHRGLARAVDDGTATVLRTDGELLFAKTGTTVADGEQEGRVVAWRPEVGEALVLRAPGVAGRDAVRLAAFAWAQATERREPHVRVGRLRASPERQAPTRIDVLPIERYVAAVIGAEADPTAPPASLDALAVVVRSYALAPDGRHARDGYDVCDTTHCQVMGTAAPWSTRAAAATRGVVLTHEGRVAAVPYSASCPGLLVSPRELWGGEVPTLTVVGPEPAPHAVVSWSREVDHGALVTALRAAGLQGARLDGLRVSRRTSGGVPQVVTMEGLTPPDLPATRFRAIVGRRLGWDVLKGDAWDVTRTAGGYRFSGRGKGHGAGLCLAGAGRLAASGGSGRRILGAYVPGADVWSGLDEIATRVPAAWQSQVPALRGAARTQMAALRLTLGVTSPRAVTIEVHPTAAAYQRATGRAWWTGASTRWLGGTSYRIDVAPSTDAARPAALLHTLAHEFVHVLTASTLRDAPAWVGEGLASLAPRTQRVEQAGASGPCPLDDEVHAPGGLDAMRTVYARAEACVRQALPDGVKSWRTLAY